MEYRNKKRALGIRVSVMLLSLVMTVTMMPAFAFAETEQQDTPPEVSAQTSDGQTQQPEAIITDEDVDAQEQPTETSDENEPDSEENEAETSVAADDEEMTGLESVSTESDLPDADVMLRNYLDTQISAETGTSLNTDRQGGEGLVRRQAKLASRRTVLSEADQKAYDLIRPYIVKIAAGDMDRAYFAIPEASGRNYIRVIEAMMTDMPYEFYWHDKVEGYLHGKDSAGRHVFYFGVSKDYWNSSIRHAQDNLVYGLNTTKLKRTKAAVNHVSQIINEYAGADDINRLYGYRNRICEYATYDKSAETAASAYSSGASDAPFYGDPWQLIYVFDGDDSTNAVCEGYSKAFQYLCDRTAFSSGIKCHTVSGDLVKGSVNLGGHMWNIIHMGNGGNYIADITNSDNGTYAVESYFLKGYSAGNVADGYRFSRLTYIYDKETKALFTEEELTLSDTDYDIGEPEVRHYPARAATCTTEGYIEHWLRLGYYYSDESCSEESRMKYSDTFIKAYGHSWSSWSRIKAQTCTTAGTEQRKCSRCRKTETRSLAAYGHSWRTSDSLDSVKHTCSRCRSSYTVSKVVTDLPAVSIKGPRKAKKSFTVKWKKLSKKNRNKVSGVEIQYSTRNDFASSYKIVTAKKTAASKKISKLPRKTTYYVRVRTYKWISGKKHVSKWSAVKKVRTK